MLNFYKKLSLVVLSGALTLGLSHKVVAKGDFRATNWLAARQQLDCPMTCKAREMYVKMSGTDHTQDKPISICTTKKDKRGEWLVGYNRWKENTCILGVGDTAYHGERYYCLCTT
ncbi:MAG: hypothetical protein VSS75_008400, partial [Candidatus Parabeggiatoa sp.]|nr:hypothetical protein [Candidatus Parabeggiatoa sp.]